MSVGISGRLPREGPFVSNLCGIVLCYLGQTRELNMAKTVFSVLVLPVFFNLTCEWKKKIHRSYSVKMFAKRHLIPGDFFF